MNSTTASDAGQSWDFALPKSFRPTDVLPAKLAQRGDETRFFLNCVVRKTASRDTDAEGYARLDSRVTRSYINWRADSQVKAALVDAGVLERDTHIEGVRCAGYRLTKHWLSDRCQRVKPVCPYMIRNLAKMREQFAEEQRKRRLPIHDRLNEVQHRYLTIDADYAERILETLPRHCMLCQSYLVKNLSKRRLTNSVGSTGRYFNALTGLKRDLRYACRFDDSIMDSVDISCCQPALLAMLLNRKIPPAVLRGVATYKVSLPSASDTSLVRFSDSCADGSLYSVVADSCGLSVPDVKSRFLVDFLAPKSFYPSVVRDAVERLFPSVGAYVRDLHSLDFERKKRGSLICLLQRLESWLVVETIAPRILERCPALTLHDAVFAKASDIETVKEVFSETLESLGCRLSLKVERW